MQTEKDSTFEALLDYLKQTRSFDFTSYKRSTLIRRVGTRLQAVGLGDYVEYLHYFEAHPEEYAQLFNAIAINTTGFFRDEADWEFLAREIIPRILNGKASDDPIRVWSAGCSSGEETYTLVMLLAEVPGAWMSWRRVKIFATDVDEDALIRARSATFTGKALQAVPASMRSKYFESQNGSYVVRGDLRQSVTFGRHDLLRDPPISRLDLVVCRNTLMYFNAEARARVLGRLHFGLKDNGILFLGRAETLLAHSNLFTPIDLSHRVFVKATKVPLRDRLLALAPVGYTQAAAT